MWDTMNCKVEQKELEVVVVPGENCLIIGRLENRELKSEESILPLPVEQGDVYAKETH